MDPEGDVLRYFLVALAVVLVVGALVSVAHGANADGGGGHNNVILLLDGAENVVGEHPGSIAGTSPPAVSVCRRACRILQPARQTWICPDSAVPPHEPVVGRDVCFILGWPL